jgi:hypothetical protein
MQAAVVPAVNSSWQVKDVPQPQSQTVDSHREKGSYPQSRPLAVIDHVLVFRIQHLAIRLIRRRMMKPALSCSPP